MDTTTSTKRMRKSSVILTDRLCTRRVNERIKYYDRKCAGLYVSITPAGVATFSFKFTDPETGKQRTVWLGVYSPETFTVGGCPRQGLRPQGHGRRSVGRNLPRSESPAS
ncbi:MAG TPA: hypothetical protein VGJ20_31140 [Xanthobacteraceae bacterium]|jgi:hypothetical protein